MKEKDFNIKEDSIVKQVKAKAYYTGRSRGETSAQESVITDILDSENEHFIESSVRAAVYSVQSVIGACMPCKVEAKAEGEYRFVFTVPDHFDVTAISNLQSNTGKFCEAKVLYDWFASTSPADAATYAQLMSQALEEVQSNMRRRLHPSQIDKATE